MSITNIFKGPVCAPPACARVRRYVNRRRWVEQTLVKVSPSEPGDKLLPSVCEDEMTSVVWL